MADSLTRAYKKVGSKLIDAALERGYTLSLVDGESTVVRKSNDAKRLKSHLCSTDEDILVVYNLSGDHIGHIYLMYGNAVEETIFDYTWNPLIEALVATVRSDER